MITPLAAATDDVALIFIELGAIFFGLALAARVSHRFRISPIPLYLLAGVAFGEGGLAPLDLSRDFVELAGEIGVVLLLLTLGLEYTPRELRAGLRRGALPAVADLLANAAPGFVAALLLGWSIEAAVVLAGITYISSSGIIAKLLSDLGRLGNRETPSVLTLLVTEDLVMAFYLPLVGLMLASGNDSPAITIALTVLLIAIALLVALRFGGAVSRLVRAPSDEALLLGVLGFTLVAAGLAQRADISTAVGAFLVGVALADDVSSRTEELIGPLRDLFAAAFFVIFGLELDPADVPAVLPAAAGLAAVTAATKVAVGMWAAKRDGAGPAGRWRAGTVFIARGEFSIVLAGLAIAAGDRIDPDLGALTATYVLLLAIAGPLLTRSADRIAQRLRH